MTLSSRVRVLAKLSLYACHILLCINMEPGRMRTTHAKWSGRRVADNNEMPRLHTDARLRKKPYVPLQFVDILFLHHHHLLLVRVFCLRYVDRLANLTPVTQPKTT